MAGTGEEGIKAHHFNIPKPKGPAVAASKYDPAPWNEYFDTMDKIDGVVPCYYAGTSGHVFLCLHGAGHSALSFAALAKILKNEPYNSTCVSFDFRGHGGHYCENEHVLS
jgi:protein phosphatase methylesterase 1